MAFSKPSELHPVNRLALWSEYPNRLRGVPMGCLRLSVQTNPGSEFKNAIWRANSWRPRAAKTFDIVCFIPTDYNGIKVPLYEHTGYARFEVVYYANKSGAFPVGDYGILP